MEPDRFAQLTADVEAQLRRVIVGQDALVRDVLACLFAGGHVLLEGVPGLGKTVLLRTLAQTLSLDSTRLQCTPDLLPADVVGTTVLGGDGGTGGAGWHTSFEPGPVFTQLLLADELNRATPKTQSALLEAMAERRVTVGGVTRDLPQPFFVMATQNPIEMEGTYPLPEAQLDRFMAKVLVPTPSADDLVEILVRTTGSTEAVVEPVAGTDDLLAAIRLVREVPMASHVLRHVAELVEATHANRPTAPEAVVRYVTNGASPRGGQSLVLSAKVRALFDGRLQASVEDVREAAAACLRHRLVLGYEALIAGVTTDDVVAAVLDAVPAPRVPA
ncbi:AAA family ATPase [Egicoccus sp. AB-alg6-2]|uniref:AAA family ATPase n=1 Tax=Egicoccus sp. AB-alg6-2 TaxID=3242692 RepID=UPI00359DB4B5